MAFNWFLVVAAVIVSLVILAFVAMIYIYFSHPDDSNSAYFPKGVAIFCLFLACANVLLLPLDVASGQSGGNLDMAVAWDIAIWTTAVFLFFIIPFAYFYYENDQLEETDTSCCCGLVPNWNGQLCEGLKWSIGSLVCFGLLLSIMWIFLHWADIPVKTRTYDFNGTHRVAGVDDVPNSVDCSDGDQCTSKTLKIEIEVTIGVFLIALLSFLGWYLFVVFGGMGLVMLPWDLLSAYRTRPVPMGLEEYASKKAEFRERSTLLREAGHAIKNDELYNQGKGLSRAEKREMAETLHRFENAVYMLKKDFIHTETAFKLRGGNPFFPYLKLLMAIIGGSMSLMWIIHICVFILPPKPADPLLNTLFIKLSIPGFPLFGVCAFGLYVGWLLFAVMKGNFRVGLRIACCRVFPMEYNNTLTNSFLANSWLILLCSFVVVQFSAIAFPIYARNSTVDLIFGTQIRYMRFFTYFFANNVFVICFLVFAFLGVLWMILCPRDDGARIEDELQKAMSGKKITKRHIEMAGK